MPLPNEHAARLMSPSTEHSRVRRSKGKGTVQGVSIPGNISVIWFIQNKDGKSVPVAQSLRFPTRSWSENEAIDWLKTNKIKHSSFEAAEVKSEDKLCYTHYIDESAKKLDIILHDVIGFEGSQSKDFHELLADESINQINIDINSPGGSVTDGLSIYNRLKEHPANIHVKISGVAASMASVIAMAADEIEMPETALMMIHKPLVPFMMGANADKLRETAETLDKMEGSIIKAYDNRMDMGVDEIGNLMRDTTWFSADEAKESGLADVITEEEIEIENYHDFTAFDYSVPDVVMNMYSVDADQEISFDNIEEPVSETLITKLKKYFQPLNTNVKEKDMTTEQVAQLTEENKVLTDRITVLETENTAFKTAQETASVAKVETECTSFCETMVTEGRIRPVDVDIHVKTMVSKETPEDVIAYQDWLKTLPKMVDTSTEHVASKNKINDTSVDDKFAAMAKKIQTEKKITYADALREAYKTNPDLYDTTE